MFLSIALLFLTVMEYMCKPLRKIFLFCFAILKVLLQILHVMFAPLKGTPFPNRLKSDLPYEQSLR